MREFLAVIFSGLVPPHDATPAAVFRWRTWVAVILMANSVSIVVVTVLAFGGAPLVFGGFARSETLENVTQKIANVRTDQLDAKILETRTRQCSAILSKNEPALQFATQRLQEQLRAWLNLRPDQKEYRLPACEEL